MVEQRLFEKASAFSDAALTFQDENGYPFSIPVSFEVDAKEKLVRILRLKSIPSLAGRSVEIIFNHVTPLPTGGYTDRRYIVFWGQLQGEGENYVLKPTKGFVWDEKEVPFFQYSEIKVPQARRYLHDLQEKPWLSTPWLIMRTFRLPFVIATILPISLGAIIAYRAGFFDWALFALTMLGALLVHLGVNTANDYFDSRSGADDINTTPTPFSGGSRIIQYGLLPPRAIFSISTSAYVAGCLIGLYLAYTRGILVLIIGLLGLLISYGYTAPPFKFAYRGVGELVVAVGFGPLLVLGSYFVQARALSLEAFLGSLPMGLLIMLILYVNEVPDRTWDEEANKKTLVSMMPEERVSTGYSISIAAVYVIIIVGVIGRIFPIPALLGLGTLPLALKIRKLIQENLGNPYGLMPAMSNNVRFYVYTGALILAGYVISLFLHI